MRQEVPALVLPDAQDDAEGVLFEWQSDGIVVQVGRERRLIAPASAPLCLRVARRFWWWAAVRLSRRPTSTLGDVELWAYEATGSAPKVPSTWT